MSPCQDATNARPRLKPCFLPAHLLPHLAPPLGDAEATNPVSYKLVQLEEIEHEQTPESYRHLQELRAQWHAEGDVMLLIQWIDSTQGVLRVRAGEGVSANRLLDQYHQARSARELFAAGGGSA